MRASRAATRGGLRELGRRGRGRGQQWWPTYADEAALRSGPAERRLGIDLGSQIVGGPDSRELGDLWLRRGARTDAVGYVPSWGFGVAAVRAVEELGRRRRLIGVVLGVWHHAGYLLLLVVLGGGAARVVGALALALGVVVGLPRGRLPRHGPAVLGGHGVLGAVGRRGRQGLHGRISLGGGRGFLRGMEAGGPTAARQLVLVMGSHGVFDAGVRIIDVLHGDVAADVSTLRGVGGREGGRQRGRVVGGSGCGGGGGGVMIVAVGGGGWRLCVLELLGEVVVVVVLAVVGLGGSLGLSLMEGVRRVRRRLGQRSVILITGCVARRAGQVEPVGRRAGVWLPLWIHGLREGKAAVSTVCLPLPCSSPRAWPGPRNARVAGGRAAGRGWVRRRRVRRPTWDFWQGDQKVRRGMRSERPRAAKGKKREKKKEEEEKEREPEVL